MKIVLSTVIILMFFMTIHVNIEPCNGKRTLFKGLLLQSLQKGEVPSSGSSSCSFIPSGGSSGGCPLDEMHFAGVRPHHAKHRVDVRENTI
ncbi:hypothetical protein RND81_14G132300 [Saponaria officinalis]|uniref:Transmembrane protein n=1 Tax=Saponaria officinalis TaxID=3572 RepID=A0AAW1GQB9_SAPOF